jgi:hypothetical protein
MIIIEIILEIMVEAKNSQYMRLYEGIGIIDEP